MKKNTVKQNNAIWISVCLLVFSSAVFAGTIIDDFEDGEINTSTWLIRNGNYAGGNGLGAVSESNGKLILDSFDGQKYGGGVCAVVLRQQYFDVPVKFSFDLTIYDDHLDSFYSPQFEFMICNGLQQAPSGPVGMNVYEVKHDQKKRTNHVTGQFYYYIDSAAKEARLYNAKDNSLLGFASYASFGSNAPYICFNAYTDTYYGSVRETFKLNEIYVNSSLNSSDLIVSVVSYSGGTYKTGDSLTYSGYEKNIGTAEVNGNYYIDLYLSKDKTFDNSDIRLTRDPQSDPLGPGEKDGSGLRTKQIPANTTSGSYYLIAVIDPTGAIVETNENNNQWCSKSANITVIDNRKSLYQENIRFRVGTAVKIKDPNNKNLLDGGQYGEYLAKHFNFVTPDNASKWDHVQHNINEEYNFNDLNSLCMYVKNVNQNRSTADKIQIKGHPLVWHNQNPEGLGEKLNSEKDPISVLENHIEIMMVKYKAETNLMSSINYWDVVNEAFNENGDPRGINDVKDGVAWAVYGGETDEYIHRAFARANKVNPNAILIYNDYNIETFNKKSNAVYKLLKELLETNSGLKKHLGVGFQCHFYLKKNPQGKYIINLSDNRYDFEPVKITGILWNLATFARLDSGNLQLFVSELDVAIDPSLKGDLEAYQAQAKFYYDFVSTIGTVKNLKAITLWGFTDKDKYYWTPRWNENEQQVVNWLDPLLWDNNYASKPALGSFVNGLQRSAYSIIFQLTCPIDAIIMDPAGYKISKNINEIQQASYIEEDSNGDLSPDDTIIIPKALYGDYTVNIVPDSTAQPTDLVSLSVFDSNTDKLLLDEVQISDLPESLMYKKEYHEIKSVKCAVKAGTVSDGITFTGVVDTAEVAFADANDIIVNIYSETMAETMNFTFPVTTSTYKKGKFNGKNSNSSLKLDAKTGKISFSAKNVDLTGLACPIAVTIVFGNYAAQAELTEAVVNGTKPCPIQLLQGMKNTLDITKKTFKKGSTVGRDSLTVSGTFTVAGDYLKAPLTITVGSQTFTVPIDKMGDKNNVASCNAKSTEGINAKLDYNKCTFTISIKNADISQSGTVPFGIDCFGVSLQGLETIDLN